MAAILSSPYYAPPPATPVLVGDEWWQQLLGIGLQSRWDTERVQSYQNNAQVPTAGFALGQPLALPGWVLVGGLVAAVGLVVYLAD